MALKIINDSESIPETISTKTSSLSFNKETPVSDISLSSLIYSIRKAPFKEVVDEFASKYSKFPRNLCSLHLEYTFHVAEKLILQAMVAPSRETSQRLAKLENRMGDIDNRLRELGYGSESLKEIFQAVSEIIPNYLSQIQTNLADPASLNLRGELENFVISLLEKNPNLTLSSILSTATIDAFNKYDNNSYKFGGSGIPSRLDRSQRNEVASRSRRNGIDCSHFVWRCRQEIAIKLGIDPKSVKYMTSRQLHAAGEISLKDAIKQNILREGDVIAYPGHTAIVGRDPKSGELVIKESTRGINSRSGKYESGVQINSLDKWIDRNIGKNPKIYRDSFNQIA